MINKKMFKKPKNILENKMENLDLTPCAPDDMYTKCTQCSRIILSQEIENNHNVCPNCNAHFRISARKRIEYICSNFIEMDKDLSSINILNFPYYDDKLEKARTESGELEAVITGVGNINGIQVALFAMEPNFMMGSMGSIVGEKITRLFEHATRNKLAVIGFIVSGGARMQEGIISLMQMAKTSGAVKAHSQTNQLYIAVLTDPTTGGVTASFAMGGDIIIAEPNALIGFAGPRVIEQTIKQKLPEGFQKSEFLLSKGFLDCIIHRHELKNKLFTLLKMHNYCEAVI